MPTWNFSAVHIYGKASVINDRKWLVQLLDEMVTDAEKPIPNPWKLSDATPDYFEKLLTLISGISIEIERIESKFKLSQNQPMENVKGVIDGLLQRQDSSSEEVSKMIIDFNSKRDEQ